MNNAEYFTLLERLVSEPTETEWLEFKHNFHSKEEIGERLSALSNNAALAGRPYGYLVFGVEDGNHNIIGTTFRANNEKVGGEDLEHWLVNRLNPRIDIESIEFDYGGKHISMYKIPAATTRPVSFFHTAYIRVKSITRKLQEYPEKEAKLWNINRQKPLNKIAIKVCRNSNEVIALLSVETYFDRLKIPMPQTSEGIIERFLSEGFIMPGELGFEITELGAILLAKDFRQFDSLYRKAVRVIVYKGKGKTETIREQSFE